MLLHFQNTYFICRSPSASSSTSSTVSPTRETRSATSWLSKTFKRAFTAGADGTYVPTSDKASVENRKLVIPQVQITEDKNFWGSNGVHPTSSLSSTTTTTTSSTMSTTPTKVSDKIAKDKKKKKSIK